MPRIKSTERITITLPLNTLKTLEHVRGDVTRSRFISRRLEEVFKNES